MRWMHAGALTFGLILAYALFGAAAAVFSGAFQYSREIFIGMAALLVVCGARALAENHGMECCERTAERRASVGASFLLGGSFAFVVSPCCTPVIAAIVAYSAASANAPFGAFCLASFALGHALPLLFLTAGSSVTLGWVSRLRLSEGVPVVSASMMFALAAYYGLLA